MLIKILFYVGFIFAQDPHLKLEAFGKKEVTIGGKKITVYLADEVHEHAQGLMKVKSLPTNTGMLFVFPKEEIRTFWMKNTEIPLAIGFFSKDRKLLQVVEMTPEKSPLYDPKVYQSDKPAQYALEMNARWFEKNKIKVGSRLEF